MTANSQLFKRFLESEDTLWVYQANKPLFRSKKVGLVPLLDYIEEFPAGIEGVIVCDRVVGNAAALLLPKVCCRKVYGVVGSKSAIETLKRWRIAYSFLTEVPYISNRAGDDMCPFEKASIGKGADEFYQLVKEALAQKGS